MSEKRPLIDSEVATLIIWILGVILIVGIICDTFCFFRKKRAEQYNNLVQAIANAKTPEERATFSRELEILDIDKAASDITEEALLLDHAIQKTATKE
jgi:hypothetical protein